MTCLQYCRHEFACGQSVPLIGPTADFRWRSGAAPVGRGHDEAAAAVRARRQSAAGRSATLGPRWPHATSPHVDEGLRLRRRVLVHQMRQNVPDIARPGGAFSQVAQRQEAVLVRAVQQILRRRDKPEPTPVSRVRPVLYRYHILPSFYY